MCAVCCLRYDNRRTKMNKDSKIRRVEDARLQHLYNNFSEASALYASTAAVPFDAKPLPMLQVPNASMNAMQLTPMAHSAAVHPFLHNSMMVVNAQEEAWKRAGMAADAQQQMMQAQMHYHLTQNALTMQQHQQQHQQQQAATNSFFQSAPVAPTSNSGMAAPLPKSSSNSAFHSVVPASQSPAMGSTRSTATATTASSSTSPSSILQSPSLHAFSSPALSYPPLAVASVPASPAMPGHSLMSPVRPAAQLAFVSPPPMHPFFGMPLPPHPMHVMRQ